MSKQTTPTGTGDQPTGSPIDRAAMAFDAMLAPPPEDTQEGNDEQPGAEAQGDEAESGESMPGEVESAGEEDSGSEDEQSEEQTEGGEEQEEQQAPEPKFTVRVDGKDEEVSQSELIAGYSRTSDYTRKTQALSNDRKAFVAAQEAVSAERAEYAKLLPKLREALATGMEAEPNWAELKEKDPQQYLIQKDQWNERKQRIAAVQEQERKTAERSAKEREAQIEQIAVEQHNKLLERLPAWRDTKVATKEGELIVAALQAVGFSGQELEIFDHRAILIARKAALYDKHVADLAAAKGKVREQRVPVAKPGATVRTNKDTERAKADRSRLNKTGSVRDAGKVFENFLK